MKKKKEKKSKGCMIWVFFFSARPSWQKETRLAIVKTVKIIVNKLLSILKKKKYMYKFNRDQ